MRFGGADPRENLGFAQPGRIGLNLGMALERAAHLRKGPSLPPAAPRPATRRRQTAEHDLPRRDAAVHLVATGLDRGGPPGDTRQPAQQRGIHIDAGRGDDVSLLAHAQPARYGEVDHLVLQLQRSMGEHIQRSCREDGQGEQQQDDAKQETFHRRPAKTMAAAWANAAWRGACEYSATRDRPIPAILNACEGGAGHPRAAGVHPVFPSLPHWTAYSNHDLVWTDHLAHLGATRWPTKRTQRSAARRRGARDDRRPPSPCPCCIWARYSAR